MGKLSVHLLIFCLPGVLRWKNSLIKNLFHAVGVEVTPPPSPPWWVNTWPWPGSPSFCIPLSTVFRLQRDISPKLANKYSLWIALEFPEKEAFFHSEITDLPPYRKSLFGGRENRERLSWKMKGERERKWPRKSMRPWKRMRSFFTWKPTQPCTKLLYKAFQQHCQCILFLFKLLLHWNFITLLPKSFAQSRAPPRYLPS